MIALLTGGSSVALGTGSAGTLRGCPTGERHVKAAGTLFLVAKSLWEPERPTLRPWAACRFREPGLPGPSTHALGFSSAGSWIRTGTSEMQPRCPNGTPALQERRSSLCHNTSPAVAGIQLSSLISHVQGLVFDSWLCSCQCRLQDRGRRMALMARALGSLPARGRPGLSSGDPGK